MTDEIIVIPKNSTEEIRVYRSNFNGYDLAVVRVFYQPADGGEMRPGKSGINVRIEQVPAIIAALQKIVGDAD